MGVVLISGLVNLRLPLPDVLQKWNFFSSRLTFALLVNLFHTYMPLRGMHVTRMYLGGVVIIVHPTSVSTLIALIP